MPHQHVPPKGKSSSNYSFFESYTALVAAFSFLCIGLLRAYTSPAISSMKDDPYLFNSTTEAEQKDIISWVASSPPVASFIGTMIAGPMLQFLGRRGTLIALTVPYIIGWLTIGFAGTSIALIIIGRLLTGLAAGLCTAGAQLYVSECVRAEVRGTLGFLPSMMLAAGVLLGFALSTLNLDWKNFAFVMTSFPVVLLIMSVTVPESPSWLILRGRENQGFKNLRKLRGKKNEEAVEMEILDLKRTIQLTNRRVSLASIDPRTKKVSIIKMMQQRPIWFPAFIAVFLMFFQQFAGANAVIYYLSIILTEAEPQSFKMLKEQLLKASNGTSTTQLTYGLDHNFSSVIVGIVQFLAFFVSLPLIDRLGRRILLISSAVAMSIPLGTLGFYYYCNQPQFFLSPAGTDKCASLVESTGVWLPVTCLSVFIAAYSIGFGPVCFILMGELFPTQARSYLCSLTSFVNHLCLLILIRGFPIALDLIGGHGAFWGFSLCCLISIFFVLWVVPETKGKTLAEIERSFVKEEESLL